MTNLFAHATAKRLRDAGLAEAEAHAPKFSARAYAAIADLARRSPTLHIDDVILFTDVGEAPHPNAWGAVWMKAIRAGLIARTAEVRPCRHDPKKHGHQYPVYRSLVWEGPR